MILFRKKTTKNKGDKSQSYAPNAKSAVLFYYRRTKLTQFEILYPLKCNNQQKTNAALHVPHGQVTTVLFFHMLLFAKTKN